MKKYFYLLIGKYLSLFIRPDNSVVEIHPQTDLLVRGFKDRSVILNKEGLKSVSTVQSTSFAEIKDNPPDYLILNGCVHYEKDIEALFNTIHNSCKKDTRLLITFYSSLWKPLILLASFLKIRTKTPEQNWITKNDLENFFRLTNFEIIRYDSKILLPIYIPIISAFANRILAPVPIFRWFTMLNIVVARPLNKNSNSESVSVIIPARNEAGNIENILKRIPQLSSHDEIIFIEGHSKDNTWQKIQEVKQNHIGIKNIIIAQQDGKGKGDAVRKGFGLATNDILMILDADISVMPEDLSRFYKVIREDKGEFINGSRLVYPMEKKAMRFFNILGNKFFAEAFSFVLCQRLKDTLCGTKVLTRNNYLKIAQQRSYFGNFDPFGDFDLIFGASRMGLKIIEVPICYKQRVYGSTNIQRWKHGMLLFKMLFHAARKIKFI
jgi:hypothetical protein